MTQIYSATYSGVEVYEFIATTGSVMMRKSDGWVNATHILKTANFPKAKRTRILERDVQVGTHDKVQGGYGKYQGTYVPLDRARAIAREFGVSEILEDLFDAQEAFANTAPPPPAPKHHHATKNNSIASEKQPSQRKAALARKVASMPIISHPKPAPAATPLKKKTRAPKKQALSRVSNPNEGVFVGRRLNGGPGVTQSLRMSDSFDDDDADTDVEEEQEDEETGVEMESEAELNENDGLDSDIEDSAFNLIDGTSSPSEFMSDADLANALKSPAVNPSARESLERAVHHNGSDSQRTEKWIDPNAEYTGRLLEYFLQPDDATTESRVPEFLLHPPKGVNLDQVIDEDGHTTFHWACSMGNTEVVEALMNLGANYRAVNNAGETPLMRAAQFTNAYTKKTFARLVQMLVESIFELDSNFRSVLHHIAAAANTKARLPSSVYYMEIIIARISESQTPQRLEDFINLQDRNGDTALHICAQNANKKCIKTLVYHKAKGNIRNNNGRVASDILLENQNMTPKVQQRYEMHLRSKGVGLHMPTPANSTANTSNGTTGFAAPHVSEAAIEATHKVATVLKESLSELSNAYDYELHRKECDVSEVQDLLSNMNQDIRSTQEKMRQQLGDGADDKAVEQQLKLIEDQVKRHEALVQSKETKLMRVLERSQKKSLETLTAKFSKEQSPDSTDIFADAAELTKLQLNRKRMLSQILSIAAGIDSSNEKMQKYRRLICSSADIPIDEVSDKVDDLLKEIENGTV